MFRSAVLNNPRLLNIKPSFILLKKGTVFARTFSKMTGKRSVLVMKDVGMPNVPLWESMVKKHDANLVLMDEHSRERLLELIRENNVEVVVNNPHSAKALGGWTDDLIKDLPPSVKAVCHFGAGYDSVGNLAVYKEKGLQVSNTPNGVIQATADTGIYLILGTLRNFGELALSCKAGNWIGGIPLATEYDGKVLGILGLGGIGAVIRDKAAAAFDFAKIQYHNRHQVAPELEKGTKYVASFDEFLATTDVLVVAVPLNKGTHHIMNASTIAKMKKGSIIVNIARGPIIDEQAMADALESGHLRSVGLDVYEHEPKINAKLLAQKNTLLLPHVGTHTNEARDKMELDLLHNVESVLDTGSVKSLVPELR